MNSHCLSKNISVLGFGVPYIRGLTVCITLSADVNKVIIGSGNGLALNAVPSLYLSQWWIIVNWMLSNKFQLNSNWNASSLIEENVFENVICKMVAILFMPHMSPWCPNTQWPCSRPHADQISTYSVPCHVNISFTFLPNNSDQGSDSI